MTREEAKKLINECGLNINEPLHSEVLEIVNEALTVGEWIPVSERLPDKNGSYLVSFKEAITNSDGLCVKYWSGEEQRWRPCNYAPSVCWRAWMPLPEPYKVGDQE